MTAWGNRGGRICFPSHRFCRLKRWLIGICIKSIRRLNGSTDTFLVRKHCKLHVNKISVRQKLNNSQKQDVHHIKGKCLFNYSTTVRVVTSLSWQVENLSWHADKHIHTHSAHTLTADTDDRMCECHDDLQVNPSCKQYITVNHPSLLTYAIFAYHFTL